MTKEGYMLERAKRAAAFQESDDYLDEAKKWNNLDRARTLATMREQEICLEKAVMVCQVCWGKDSDQHQDGLRTVKQFQHEMKTFIYNQSLTTYESLKKYLKARQNVTHALKERSATIPFENRPSEAGSSLPGDWRESLQYSAGRYSESFNGGGMDEHIQQAEMRADRNASRQHDDMLDSLSPNRPNDPSNPQQKRANDYPLDDFLEATRWKRVKQLYQDDDETPASRIATEPPWITSIDNVQWQANTLTTRGHNQLTTELKNLSLRPRLTPGPNRRIPASDDIPMDGQGIINIINHPRCTDEQESRGLDLINEGVKVSAVQTRLNHPALMRVEPEGSVQTGEYQSLNQDDVVTPNTNQMNHAVEHRRNPWIRGRRNAIAWINVPSVKKSRSKQLNEVFWEHLKTIDFPQEVQIFNIWCQKYIVIYATKEDLQRARDRASDLCFVFRGEMITPRFVPLGKLNS
ncbi:hypothetical protein MMC25_005592 [Agyrium rufum]|nr:hypothetical protein [Agyrium rufum]